MDFQIGTTEATIRAATTPTLIDIMRASRDRARAILDRHPPTEDEDEDLALGRRTAEGIAAMDLDDLAGQLVPDGWHIVVPFARISPGGDSPDHMAVRILVLVREGIGALDGEMLVTEYEALPTREEARQLSALTP
jgi:hypothetical protein